MQARNQGNKGASGFALIEVMIALLVLSFGLLGMVGLQARALQNNREARYQSIAVSLAQELAEMMRGNKDVAMLAAHNPYLGDFSASPLKPSDASNCRLTGDSPCASPTDVAVAELTDWLARVDVSLPGARASVCLDSAPYSTSGLPQWPCTASPGSDTVVIKIGWTQLSTDARALDRSIRTDSAGSRPGIVLPVTAGSTTP
ncbi:type IV pilus modification protein PilV [Variovorax defluvii]|uniref:Type IV pilus modification protein PilV n=1 Tax=Variovorax defluvii TaxID=913761 RepID=A0ABP8GUV3_9BURK